MVIIKFYIKKLHACIIIFNKIHVSCMYLFLESNYDNNVNKHLLI